MLLKPESTCWRVETAERAAVLIDVEDYFTAVKSAVTKATQSVFILGWAFHPKTILDSDLDDIPGDDYGIAAFLKEVATRRPDLDIRILCWKAALPVAITQGLYPQRAGKHFEGSPIRFVLDGSLPAGASHHQKVVVVDDAVAFSGGCDFGPDRWDNCDHQDDNLRRAASPGEHPCFDARHEVMSVVDGDAARALGDLFRARWARATGEPLPDPRVAAADPWPDNVTPQFAKVQIGLSRSSAAWGDFDNVREVETLYLASIAAARDCIYLENQYFTSPVIAEALAQRLSEAAGPEVVLVSTQHSPSYFDQMTMDRTRSMFIKRLREADKYDRFRIFSPVTSLGRTIIVHAKLAIIDDGLLRVGSANLNNRSLGFDTECDLSIEACGETEAKTRAAIRNIWTRLIAHWLACDDEALDHAASTAGGVGGGIEALRARGHCRLRPIPVSDLKPLAATIATFHIGDPVAAWDSWRPWRRRGAAKRELAKVAAQLRAVDLPTVRGRLSPETV